MSNRVIRIFRRQPSRGLGASKAEAGCGAQYSPALLALATDFQHENTKDTRSATEKNHIALRATRLMAPNGAQ
jgi:hypothetical protein